MGQSMIFEGAGRGAAADSCATLMKNICRANHQISLANLLAGTSGMTGAAVILSGLDRKGPLSLVKKAQK